MTTTTTTTSRTPEWILVTGQPGSGKTTAVKKIVDFLQAHGKTCRGFYTDEVLLDGGSKSSGSSSRIGFDVVTVPDGKRGVLSRKAGFGLSRHTTKHKTGQYFVDVPSFETIALPSLAAVATTTATAIATAIATATTAPRKRRKLSNNDDDDDVILVLDEIGRMELHSTAFSERIRELLEPESITTTTTTTTTSRKRLRLVGAITAPIYGHRVPFCDEVSARQGVEVHKLTKKTRDDVVQGLLQSIEDRGWLEKR